MNEVLGRIKDLEKIKRGMHKLGNIWGERWAIAEIAEMKVILKHMKTASAATETA
jgi:hypothetical protein